MVTVEGVFTADGDYKTNCEILMRQITGSASDKQTDLIDLLIH